MKKVAIIGAGITGLSLGWFLKKKGYEFLIFEEKERAGGLIQTVEKNGFLFELGPRGFRSSGKGRFTSQLVQELGLEKELIEADKGSKKRYLYQKGKLQLFSPLYLLKAGALKALYKDLTGPKPFLEDTSIAEFSKRRLGGKLLEKVIDPLVLGIYAGDPKKLSMKSCFPKLWELQKGPLIKSTLKPRKKGALFSFRGGMQTLTDTLSKELSDHLFLKTPIQKIEKLKKGFLLHLPDKLIEVETVVSAIPDFHLAKIFNTHFCFPSLTLSTVALAWRDKELPEAGYGFLAPTSEQKPFLGMTNDGEIFKKGKEIRLSVMIRQETREEKLKEIALTLIYELFALQNPDAILIHTANRAITQYEVGHHRALENLRKGLPENFHIIGRSFDGVGVNDCIHATQNLSAIL